MANKNDDKVVIPAFIKTKFSTEDIELDTFEAQRLIYGDNDLDDDLYDCGD